jgi:protein-disulfide isomerase
MKIKKQPENWHKDLVCPFCKTEMEVDEDDLVKVTMNNWHDGDYVTLAIQCPNCERFITGAKLALDYWQYTMILKQKQNEPTVANLSE